MKKTVKQFGLKRSGTNWLYDLLTANFNVKVLTNGGGWKHGEYRVKRLLGHETDCVVISKDPFSWLVSMHRYRAKWGKESFARLVNDGDMIAHWSVLHRNWLDAAARVRESVIAFIRYEDVLRSPKQTLQLLAGKLDIERSSGDWIIETRRVVPGGGHSKNNFNRRPYYLNRAYMNSFNEKMVDTVRRLVDEDVVTELGYRKHVYECD